MPSPFRWETENPFPGASGIRRLTEFEREDIAEEFIADLPAFSEHPEEDLSVDFIRFVSPNPWT